MDRRRLLIALTTLGLLTLVFVPAIVTFGLGWLQPPHIQPWGAPPAKDTTTLEAWVLFALLYLVWMVALSVLLVWAFDRLDYRWQYHERSPRAQKKQRRRITATMRALHAEDEARLQVMRRRAEKDARRRSDRAAPGSGADADG